MFLVEAETTCKHNTDILPHLNLMRHIRLLQSDIITRLQTCFWPHGEWKCSVISSSVAATCITKLSSHLMVEAGCSFFFFLMWQGTTSRRALTIKLWGVQPYHSVLQRAAVSCGNYVWLCHRRSSDPLLLEKRWPWCPISSILFSGLASLSTDMWQRNLLE